MRIRIVIPLWKRPEVTRFCFEGLKTLIAECEHEIGVTCVLSEPEYISMVESFGFNWVYWKNEPLGEKINVGIKNALKHKFDYLMMMNSDDVIKPELLNKYYKPFFESLSPFFGISKVTYVKFGTEEAVEFEYGYSVLGIGKCIRRDVVENAFKDLGELYPSQLNRMLDDNMIDNLTKIRVFPAHVKYEGMLAMDFKSDVNIHPWEKFKDRGKPVCYKAQYAEASLTGG